MAIYSGVIIGGLSGFVADSPMFGWRMAFEVCGIIGIVYALPLAFLLRDAPAVPGIADPPPTSVWQNYRELLTNGSYLLLILYFTLPAIAGWVARDWMPAILKDKFQISQGQAGFVASAYVQVAAIFGAIAGGWLADRWMHRNLRGRIYTSAIGMGLIVPAIFGMGGATTLAFAAAFLVLFGLGWGFFDSNNMPILSQIVRPHLRATGYGIMNFFSISCGGVADWAFGKLLDRGVSVNDQFNAYAVAAIVSIALVLLIRPRRELSDREPAAAS
jgi:MFS family permease